jgi:hypothetical protein
LFVRDLIPDLKAPGGLLVEKVEGLAVSEAGDVWIINDNGGVDDNSGEQLLLNLGRIAQLYNRHCSSCIHVSLRLLAISWSGRALDRKVSPEVCSTY